MTALAAQALLDVVCDPADRLLERLEAGRVALLLLLAGAHQHEPAGGCAASDSAIFSRMTLDPALSVAPWLRVESCSRAAS